jgi:hypothetical protein
VASNGERLNAHGKLVSHGTHDLSGRKEAAALSRPETMTATQYPGEYVVGWFTLSLINAGLAQSKGRSGLLWWVLSLFFGPICTLIIVLLVANDPTPSKR